MARNSVGRKRAAPPLLVQLIIENVVGWTNECANVIQCLREHVAADGFINPLAQVCIGHVGIQQQPACVGERCSGLVEILQAAQQHAEQVKRIILGAGFHAVDKGDQHCELTRRRQPVKDRHLDSAGKTRERSQAAARDMCGCRQGDAEFTYGFHTLQGPHERRGTDADRALAQFVQPQLTAAFGDSQQRLEFASLLVSNAACKQAPQPGLHSRAHLRDEALQRGDTG